MKLFLSFRLWLFLFAVCNTVCRSESYIAAADNKMNFVENVTNIKQFYQEQEAEQPTLNPDCYLTTPDLIKRHGFPVETHTVITEDHYVLTLYRIPHGRYNANTTAQRPPVLLEHGLFSQSADWLMNTVEKALGYKLADGGYDVWLGNARGTAASQTHISLSTKKSNYWDYSFHEMGKYDIPAIIDHILNKTGEPNLFYIGHSMGTTQYFVAMSLKPEYNKKIRLMVALGPSAYLDNMKSAIRYIAPLSYFPKVFWDTFGSGQLVPQFLLKFLHKYGPEYCDPDSTVGYMCKNLLFAYGGIDKPQANFPQVAIILGHSPSETSTKTVAHYAQIISSKKFQEYDYGVVNNWKKYNRLTPPQYNFNAITSPVALFWGYNDIICTPEDVERLAAQLPNLVASTPVELKTFDHLDFIFAKDADILLYNHIIDIMERF